MSWRRSGIQATETMNRPSDKVLRCMGYRADSQGIINRYMQVGDAWDDHLKRSKDFIIRTLRNRHIDNLAVYGSGWLLDFPIDDLAHTSGHIWLYDVVHPAQVLHRIRKYSNVTAVETDLTGGALMAAWEAVNSYKKHNTKTSPEVLCRAAFQPLVMPDYSISLNILSQLGQIIRDYLIRFIPYTAEELDQITCLLQRTHLKLLPQGKSCLITDIRENHYNEANHLVSTRELLQCPLPIAGTVETWDWQFDPMKVYNPGLITVSEVVAMRIGEV